jgi:hypothetical protein
MTIIEQLKAQTNNPEIVYFIENQIKARLEGKNPKYEIPTQTEVEHALDYLIDVAKSQPLKLRKASYESVVEKAKKWTKLLAKKAESVIETERDVELIRQWKDGYRLVKLVGKAAYQREGMLMKHCVGSYADRDCLIYSLRDSNNNPHCTIELTTDGENVQQIKGKGNGSVHPKYIKYVIEIIQELGGQVRSSELSNLGYQELNEDLWKLYDYACKPPKTITFGGVRYFYQNQKLKFKRAHEDIVNFLKENAS